MPREVRTDLILTSKTRGFGQSQQELGRVAREARKSIDEQVKGFESSGKAYKGAEKEIKRLEGVLQNLAVQQLAINREMEKVGDKGTKEYKALATELKNVNQEAQRVTGTITSLDRAFMRQRAARQGFVQGLMQGAAPGIAGYLQRGPGMRQQMMGQMIGGGVRRMAGAAPGMVGGIFSGAQAAAGALRGIPFIGGALAASIERPMQQAQQAMQYKQARMEAMPFLGGVGLRQQMHQAGERARQTISNREIERQATRDRIHERLIPTPDHYEQSRAIMGATKAAHVEERRTVAAPTLGGTLGGVAAGVERQRLGAEFTAQAGGQEAIDARVEALAMDISGAEAEARTRRNLTRERARRGRRAQQRVERQALGLGAGVQFGMAKPEEVQFRAGIQQVGGGWGVTQQERELGVAGMAAQRAFGVDAGVSGAFLQAGRRGGLVGGEGGAAEMLTDSIADAMKLGLEGSEINNYLQQMASGINQWRTTGIPFNKQSMADIAGTLGTMGMGGVRGMAVAGGVSRAAEQLSRTGPQSVGQLMMLQTLGGLTPGKTGMEAVEDALIRLEKKAFTGKDFQQLIGALMKSGGGGAEGRRTAFGTLRGMGIDITREEMKTMAEGADPKRWMELREQRIAGEKLAERTAGSPEGMIAAAVEMVPNALKTQASLTNRQIEAGGKMVGAMQKLEGVAQTITDKMGDIGPTVERIATSLETFTEKMIQIMEGKKGILETVFGGVQEGP